MEDFRVLGTCQHVWGSVYLSELFSVSRSINIRVTRFEVKVQYKDIELLAQIKLKRLLLLRFSFNFDEIWYVESKGHCSSEMWSSSAWSVNLSRKRLLHLKVSSGFDQTWYISSLGHCASNFCSDKKFDPKGPWVGHLRSK